VSSSLRGDARDGRLRRAYTPRPRRAAAGALACVRMGSAATIERVRAFDPFSASAGDTSGTALRYLVLDVFTDVPLEGNPLAVFTDGRGLDAGRMQRIARELNLSESVFVLPAEQGGDARIRIFTPTSEMPFAGHPTLGAAIVVGSALAAGFVTLETGAGPVAVTLDRASERAGAGTMVQPLPSVERFGDERALLAALGVARSRLPVELYRNGPRHVFVAAQDDAALAALAPDLGALERLGELCVSCFAGAGRAWTSRMFAPALGVAEDPATGSAAGPLAVHLARHGEIAFGQEIAISQGAAIGRPSRLRACAHGDAERLERVEVGGAAVIVASAQLRL
jgi:trans-2,3-dihydro-3-hydroxyanthranilate isomerase